MIMNPLCVMTLYGRTGQESGSLEELKGGVRRCS